MVKIIKKNQCKDKSLNQKACRCQEKKEKKS